MVASEICSGQIWPESMHSITDSRVCECRKTLNVYFNSSIVCCKPFPVNILNASAYFA